MKTNLRIVAAAAGLLASLLVCQPALAQKSGGILVFLIRNEAKCAECGQELWRGRMITLNRDRGALCLGCADLDHLEFLASGGDPPSLKTLAVEGGCSSMEPNAETV